MDDTPSITLTIMAGSSGGLVIYDVTTGSQLVFGGNLDETTAFVRSVMGELIVSPDQAALPAAKPAPVAAFRKVGQRVLADALTHADMYKDVTNA